MWKQQKLISIWTLAAALILSACSLNKDQILRTPPGGLTLTRLARGKALYASNCLSCHGEMESVASQNWTADDVARAIATVRQMSYLTNLATSDLEAISMALNPPPDTTAPSVPTGLTASALGPTSMSLTWQASRDDEDGGGVQGYTLFRNGEELGTVEATTLSFSDDDLTPSTDYAYTAVAFDVEGNRSAASAVVTGRTAPPLAIADTIAPSVPTAVSAVIPAAGTGSKVVRVSWGASTDNVGGSGLRNYKIYRDDSLLATVSSSTLSYNDAAVMAATTYSYKVSAIDAQNNESARSTAASATTSSVDGTDLYNRRCLTCHFALNVSDVRNKSAATISANIGTATTPGLSGAMAGLKDLSQDEIAAIALMLSDASDQSAPNVPTGVTVTSSNYDRALITWNASTDNGNSGMKGYEIFRDGAKIFTALTPTPATASQNYADVGLSERTTYKYKVRALDKALNVSAFTSEVSVTTGGRPATPDTQKPSIPTGFSGTATNTGGANVITVTWAASTDNVGVTAYKIYRTGSAVVLSTINAPARSYSDSGLIGGTQYSYQVEAYDAAGNKSDKSTAFTYSTLAPNGTTLYAARCQSCHGNVSSSDLKFRAPTVSQFVTLFNRAVGPVASGGVGAMQGKGQPAVELNAIAAVLAGEEEPNPVPSRNSVYTYSVPMGTREYMASYYSRIFVNYGAGKTFKTTGGGATTTDENLRLVIFNQIYRQASLLGGSCTQYETTAHCPYNGSSPLLFVLSSQSPGANAARAGYALNVCAQMLETGTAINNALSRVALTNASPLNDANLTALYTVFFPYTTIDAAVLNALRAQATSAATNNLSLVDSWRTIALPLCEAGALGGL